MVEESRDCLTQNRLILINLKFREKENLGGGRGDFNYQNLLVKLKHLILTVQIALLLSGIHFPILQSFAFLEKSILVLYHYYPIQKFV